MYLAGVCVCIVHIISEICQLTTDFSWYMLVHTCITATYVLLEPKSEAFFTPTKHDVISLSSGSEYGMPQKPDVKRTKLSFGRYICVGFGRI